MSSSTCIRGADWMIAWDADTAQHRYLRNADLTFTDGRIDFVGTDYQGIADVEIDGRGTMVMPGLVNIHCHPYNQTLLKGIREELGNPHFHGSGLYDFTHLYPTDEEGRRASAEYTLCELLLCGVTTVADLSRPYQGWVELLAKSGIRACAGPMYDSARWAVKDGREIVYSWDEQAGHREFDRALAIIEEAERHPCGRLFGMIAPGTFDTVSEELLRDGFAAAEEGNRPYQVHLSESVPQFNAITHRHGKTPLQWAREIGILSPRSGIGHGIFLDHHPFVYWSTREDLAILADTGTSLAHCPTVFSRYGHTLRSFGGYRRAGVNIGIGTDTFPNNLIEEMRTATILSKVADGNIFSTNLSDVFETATVGGARHLQRDDVGRLAPGAKADFVLVDLTHPFMQPVRDPLRSLVFIAAERAVRDVYVEGVQVVAAGKVLTLDMADAAMRAREAQLHMEAAVPTHDDVGRTADQVTPLSLPLA